MANDSTIKELSTPRFHFEHLLGMSILVLEAAYT